MKPLTIFAGILFLCLAGCKTETAETPEIKILTAAEIEKAFEYADSSRIIGEPRRTELMIWDSVAKVPAILHQTTSILVLSVPLNENREPVRVDSTTARKIIVRTPVTVTVVCSFSCAMAAPGGNFCQGANGCSYDRATKDCSSPDCGAGCYLSRPCKLEKTYGMSYGVIMW